MMLAIGGIAALGVMDERALVVGIRLELSREQRVLATVLATELREKLEAISGDGPCFDKAVVDDGVWQFGEGAVVVEPRKILHGEALSGTALIGCWCGRPPRSSCARWSSVWSCSDTERTSR